MLNPQLDLLRGRTESPKIPAMPGSTRFAVCRFHDDSTKSTCTCVVYQDKDYNIRESRYDSIQGWNAQPDPIVVSQDKVMENSPLAMAAWNSGQEV
jgi:hypothetical protein